MNYGFVIDTRSCIGCHACSVACKSENKVPLGVNRTWVKTTEVGAFPDVTRNFQVTRCNHCSNPPCVRICPVTAMVRRDDGIVEFDSDECIGCKACLQACPYDAIYIDPETKTAAKCHFCGHRVEVGLEPSCVVVCPTHSILAGDLDDPSSEISRFLGKNAVTVRKPEQGTAPKLFYVDGHDASLHPTATPRQPRGMATAEVRPLHGDKAPAYAEQHEVRLNIPGVDEVVAGTARWGAPITPSGTQGDPAGGPIQIPPARMAEHMVQVAYTAQHDIPWHWQVPAYLVTKGIGAGAFLLLAVGALTGWLPFDGALATWGGALGVLGLVATTALLVVDLEHPERFLRILLRPQWKSWLTRGAFILVVFSNVAGLWWALEVATAQGWLDASGLRWLLAALTVPLAVGGATYTAWLFAQCEGRDLWQSPLLPLHLLIQAVLAGSAGLAVVAAVVAPAAVPSFGAVLLGALVADLFALLFGELGVAHASEQAAKAAHEITHGRHRHTFWVGAIGLGHVLPLALLAVGGSVPTAAAAIAAVVGLALYEHVFVTAPQELPNS